MNSSRHVPELAISEAWHEQAFSGSLRTIDGHTVEVIHRGTWTHGFGPDFEDELILFDGCELRSGSIEIHRRTADWHAHGHSRDDRYSNVILHVVLDDDGSEVRRVDGSIVPSLAIRSYLHTPLEEQVANPDWNRFGNQTCAPELAEQQPAVIRTILWHLGDTRLASKSARMEAAFSASPPAEVLYTAVWDSLGFSSNRAPMRELARTLSLASIEATLSTVERDERLRVVLALHFGVAGFLPLTPTDAATALLSPPEVERLEAAWDRYGGAWHAQCLIPTGWVLGRVRPANHPILRLAAGAALLAASPAGLLASLLDPLRAGEDPVANLRELTARGNRPGLGSARASGVVTNAVIPFALALSEHTGDIELGDAAAACWERLSAAEDDTVSRRALTQVAGSLQLRALGARGQQGLIHLDATLCSPRRCYECPIALATLNALEASSATAVVGLRPIDRIAPARHEPAGPPP